MPDTPDTDRKQARLHYLIRIWEQQGHTEEELLIDGLDLDVQIETVEHMLKMAGIAID